MGRGTQVMVITVLAALLAGCESDDPARPATSAPVTSGSTLPRASEPTAVVPSFPDHRSRQLVEAPGNSNLVFTDVRVAHHEGFDRTVLEFIGTGTPGWQVNYVKQAVQEGSGTVVPLGGDAVLAITASDTTWPAPGYYSGPARFEPDGAGRIVDVYVGGTFEGYTAVAVGFDGDRAPFRVFALTEPSRLVVDVALDERS